MSNEVTEPPRPPYAVKPNTQPQGTRRVSAQNPPRLRAIPFRIAGITRDLILEMSEYLSTTPKATIRDVAKKYSVSEGTLRSFMCGTGHLTDVGIDVKTGAVVLPADCNDAELQLREIKCELTPADFAYAATMIGTNTGKLPRKIFAILYGYDPGVICQWLTPKGELTPLGRLALEKALRKEAAQKKAGKVHTDAAESPKTHMAAEGETSPAHIATLHAHTPSYTALDPAASEEYLGQLAIRYGITIFFWSAENFRILGNRGDPFMGHVDRKNTYWRICPPGSGEYRLFTKQRAEEHIMNILSLNAKGGTTALRASYTISESGIKGASNVTPKPNTLPPIPTSRRHGRL